MKEEIQRELLRLLLYARQRRERTDAADFEVDFWESRPAQSELESFITEEINMICLGRK